MRGRAKGVTAAVASAALIASGFFAFAATSTPPTAQAAAGSPGTPSAPTVVYQEDFENDVATTPVDLTAYTGATGQKYTADTAWLTACNGQIRNFNTPSTTQGNCSLEQDAAKLDQLAYALGVHADSDTPTTNHAVTAYTEGNPGANATEFQTVSNIPLASSSGRFLTFSVDAAALNCPPVASAPLYQFAFLNQAGTAANVGGQLNACSSGETTDVPENGSAPANTANVGTYTSNGSLLFSGTSLGIRMRNATGSGSGNDAAFDNIKILDVTPQLDKAFSPTTIEAGETSTLTFTVTNTSELAAKNGWSFTDDLPSGLIVASGTSGGTCDAVTTAKPGATSIAITAGTLAADETSCTITVPVTSYTAGTYTNGPDNVTETGLNPPGETTLTVTEPPAWTCSAFGYLFQTPGAGQATSIYQVDLVTGESGVVGTVSDTVNAVGYNTLDNYMYAWDNTLESVVRIASDGVVTPVTTTDITNSTIGFQVGDFDNAGHLWLMYGGTGTGAWDEIDLAPGSPTYGEVLDSGTTNLPKTISALPSDWAYVNGAFYGVQGAGPAHLVKFDPTTGVTSDLGTLANTTGEGLVWGAAYADADGNVYFSNNDTGDIIRVVPATRATIDLSDGPSSTGNDGARCASAPIPTITVTKTVAGRVQADDQFTVGLNNDAGHTLTSVTTSGTATTASTTDWPVSQDATYTITDAMADGSPDALSAYSATVVCTDTTTGETVTTGGSTGAWTLPVTTTDAYTCEVTNGPATPSYTVSKSASSNSVQQGGTITYTVTVKNTGTVPYTADDPASFTDDLSKVLDDAAYNNDATGGATVADGTLSWSGLLAVGATVTVTYSVTVDDPDTGDHKLVNAVTPTGRGGACDTADDCTTSTGVAGYTVTKTVSTTGEVKQGTAVDYTVTVTNTGQAPYTGAKPASFADDMSDVLDDASYNGDATHGATLSGHMLTWSGPLAIGQTVKITYSVTVNDPDTGNHRLLNTVDPTVAGGGCDPDGTCETTTGIITPESPVVAVNTGGYTIDQRPVWQQLLPFGGLSAALLALGAAMVLWMRRKGDQQG